MHQLQICEMRATALDAFQLFDMNALADMNGGLEREHGEAQHHQRTQEEQELSHEAQQAQQAQPGVALTKSCGMLMCVALQRVQLLDCKPCAYKL